ncbi:hypothetical protein DEO72_LG9g1231 [Vigna unguiculata]|uniref:Transmembrane protein n=1 Tax=Vigna unguiculata TaxID=3917 RepID=A0A4D6MXJ0_VIGUN|nr:hypothetical protein DEO72_LG9g1231 [Vigna unguiculata]
MDLPGFLRNLQAFCTAHKVIFTIFMCLLVMPPSYFYSFFVTGHLSNVFLTNSENLSTFSDATFHYVSFIVQVEGFAVLAISMFFLLSPISRILLSEKKVDSEAEFSITKLILIITKPARSLLVTWFLVRIVKLSCILLGILVFHQRLALMISSSCEQQHEVSHILASNFGTLILVAGGILMFTYVGSFGNLAIDISVREEISGSKALKKASEVLEGKKKVIGFVMNLVVGVISVGLFLGYLYLKTCSKVSVEYKKYMMMMIWQNISLVEFFTWGLFSTLYSACKITQPQEAHSDGGRYPL